MSYYPAWVCFPCGHEHGKGMPKGHACTVHDGVCDICGMAGPVTEPRDFGHLKDSWRSARSKHLRKRHRKCPPS